MIVARIFGIENIVGVDFCGVSVSLSSSQHFRKKIKLPEKDKTPFFCSKVTPLKKRFSAELINVQYLAAKKY